MKLTICFLGLLPFLTADISQAADIRGISIIPEPELISISGGAFTLKPDTIIYTDRASIQTGNLLAARLCQSTGFLLRVVPRSTADKAIRSAILLTTASANTNLGQEGYDLTVAPDSVVVRAPAQAGLFYGAQTLEQLLPPEIFSGAVVAGQEWLIPAVQIEDQPRFPWRGMMLDVSRDFFTKAEVERLLDLLALHKINTFHWHLVDNNGWRIEIKKYPQLTAVAAWREHPRVTPARPRADNPETGTAHPAWMQPSADVFRADGRYGGYYTQDDIREVVAYAAALHITIVPEIEMPGHSAAALLAYPELNCTGVTNGNVFCAGNDASFEFLENVLTEIFQLFPGKYVHIGGDEVNTANWKKCDLCQARMKTEGLTNADQLQSYFIRRIEKFVTANGRSLVGWSEIQKGGLAPSATVMDWKGGAVESATAGHNVVMSPEGYAYLDHYQALDHSTEPWAFSPTPGTYLSLMKVYSLEPVPAKLDPQFQSHILGAQGNLWTEYVASFKHVEYMAFPRMCAMAEVAWSPKAARNWDDFSRRLEIHLRRLEELGVNYRPLTVPPVKTNPAQ